MSFWKTYPPGWRVWEGEDDSQDGDGSDGGGGDGGGDGGDGGGDGGDSGDGGDGGGGNDFGGGGGHHHNSDESDGDGGQDNSWQKQQDDDRKREEEQRKREEEQRRREEEQRQLDEQRRQVEENQRRMEEEQRRQQEQQNQQDGQGLSVDVNGDGTPDAAASGDPTNDALRQQFQDYSQRNQQGFSVNPDQQKQWLLGQSPPISQQVPDSGTSNIATGGPAYTGPSGSLFDPPPTTPDAASTPPPVTAAAAPTTAPETFPEGVDPNSRIEYRDGKKVWVEPDGDVKTIGDGGYPIVIAMGTQAEGGPPGTSPTAPTDSSTSSTAVPEIAATAAASATAQAGGNPHQIAQAATHAAKLASDGQTLDQQSSWTRAAFRSQYGANADAEWQRQHAAELDRNQRLYGAREPKAGTAPQAGAPQGTPVAPNRRIGATRPPLPGETAQYGINYPATTNPAGTAAPDAARTAAPGSATPAATGPQPPIVSNSAGPGGLSDVDQAQMDQARPISAPTSLRPSYTGSGGLSPQDQAQQQAAPPVDQTIYRPDDSLVVEAALPDGTKRSTTITRAVWDATPEAGRRGWVVTNSFSSPARTPGSPDDVFNLLPAKGGTTGAATDARYVRRATWEGLDPTNKAQWRVDAVIPASRAPRPDVSGGGQSALDQQQAQATQPTPPQPVTPSGGGQSALDIEQQAQVPPPTPGTSTPIQNPDGSVTTERSITVTEPELNGGRPTNIPTVWGGRVVSNADAIDFAIGSGRSWPSFDSIDEAVSAAEQRSRDLGAGRIPSIGGAQVPPSSPVDVQNAPVDVQNAPVPRPLVPPPTLPRTPTTPGNQVTESADPLRQSLQQDAGQATLALKGETSDPVATAVATTTPLDTLASLAAMDKGPGYDAKQDAYNIAQGIAGMFRGDSNADWAEPYLNDVARLAWAREEKVAGRNSDPRQAPADYIEHWKDAFNGSDTRVPLVKELDQQMINYAADRTPAGKPFRWQDAFGPTGNKGLISSQITDRDCGTNAFSTILRSRGYNVTPDQTYAYGIQNGFHNGVEFQGPQAMVKMAQTAGFTATTANLDQAGWTKVDAELAAGRPVLLSGPGHWWSITAKDGQGRYYAGATSLQKDPNAQWLGRGQFNYGGPANTAVFVTGDGDPTSKAMRDMHLQAPASATPGNPGDVRARLSQQTQYASPAQRATARISAEMNASSPNGQTVRLSNQETTQANPPVALPPILQAGKPREGLIAGQSEPVDQMARVYSLAQQQTGDKDFSDGLSALLIGEGGMHGGAGDNGQSYGPYQFYWGGGEGNNFERWLRDTKGFKGTTQQAQQMAKDVDLASEYYLPKVKTFYDRGKQMGYTNPVQAIAAGGHNAGAVNVPRVWNSYRDAWDNYRAGNTEQGVTVQSQSR